VSVCVLYAVCLEVREAANMTDSADFEALHHRHVMSGYWSSADDAWMDVPDKIQARLSLGASCIPRCIHLIWLGGKLPAMLRRVAESWQAAHPAWHIAVWDDEAVGLLPLFNQAAFDSAPNRGFQADVLRYELLYRFGGFYADVDLLCLRSVAPLAALSSFVTAQSHSTVWELNNAFIGACAGHPVLALTMLAIRNGGVAAALAPPGLASELSAAAATQNSVASTANTAGGAPIPLHPYGAGVGAPTHPYAGGGFAPLHPYAGAHVLPASVGALHAYASPDLQVGGGQEASDPMHTVARTGPGVFTRATMAYAAAALQAADAATPPSPTASSVFVDALLPEAAAGSADWGIAHAATAAVLGGVPDQPHLQELHTSWSKWIASSWPSLSAAEGGAEGGAVPPPYRFEALPLVMPAKAVYPIPNTTPVGPPAVFRSDESCSAVLKELCAFSDAHRVVLSAGASLPAVVLGAAPPLPKPLAETLVGKQQRYRIQQAGVFTVHWWAQAWKRPKAQLQQGGGETQEVGDGPAAK